MKPYLSASSRYLGPPKSCDVLFYYEGLDTRTGRHRDAFVSEELNQYYKTCSNPFSNNQWIQTKGTDVLIYSMGNATMEMGLSFPLDKADASHREKYVQLPELRIPLSPGTLLVYTPYDDLFYCHEVSFPSNGVGPTSFSGYRVALVFRWLNESEERLYYLDPAKGGRHIPTAQERAKWKRKKPKNSW